MKIAVTGKGGVGKTTFAATLARLYAEEGRHVLAADVDPDANLGLALGFSEEELDTIVPISKMRKLVEERTGAGPDNQYYKINPKVDDIPDAYGKVCNGVKLLVLGTVETGGAPAPPAEIAATTPTRFPIPTRVAVETISVCNADNVLLWLSPSAFLFFSNNVCSISGNRRMGRNLVRIVNQIPAGISIITSRESRKELPPGSGSTIQSPHKN